MKSVIAVQCALYIGFAFTLWDPLWPALLSDLAASERGVFFTIWLTATLCVHFIRELLWG